MTRTRCDIIHLCCPIYQYSINNINIQLGLSNLSPMIIVLNFLERLTNITLTFPSLSSAVQFLVQ